MIGGVVAGLEGVNELGGREGAGNHGGAIRLIKGEGGHESGGAGQTQGDADLSAGGKVAEGEVVAGGVVTGEVAADGGGELVAGQGEGDGVGLAAAVVVLSFKLGAGRGEGNAEAILAEVAAVGLDSQGVGAAAGNGDGQVLALSGAAGKVAEVGKLDTGLVIDAPVKVAAARKAGGVRGDGEELAAGSAEAPVVEVAVVGDEAAAVTVTDAGGGVVGGELGGRDAVEHTQQVFVVIGDDDFRQTVAVEVAGGGTVGLAPVAFDVVEAKRAVGAAHEQVDAGVVAEQEVGIGVAIEIGGAHKVGVVATNFEVDAGTEGAVAIAFKERERVCVLAAGDEVGVAVVVEVGDGDVGRLSAVGDGKERWRAEGAVAVS